MVNNNVQNVKFLRNGSLFDTRELAKDGMLNQLNTLADGTAILGRYKGSKYATDATDVVTLVGFVFNDGTNKSITFFDIEGASADVEALRQEINAKLGDGISSDNTATAQLTALSGTSSASSGDTSVWGAKKYASAYTDSVIDGLEVAAITAPAGAFINAVSETDGKISASTAYMPTVSEIKETGKAITAVSQTNGTISATAGDIAAAHVSVDDSGSLLTATTVEGALAEIAAEIDAMDLAAVSGDGEVITAVSEQDGKVSASKTAIKDVKLTGYVKDTTKTGAISATDDIEDALSKLENKAAAITIASADKTVTVTTAATGTDVAVNIDGTTLIKNSSTGVISSGLKIKSIAQASGSSYASQYQLVYGDSETPIGDVISVAKDQFLKSATYNAETQVLTLVMYNSTGGTTNIDVDFSAAVIEAEAGEGLYVKEDHSLNVGIASSSETVTISDGQGGSTQAAVLSVNADNIEVQNIQNAIDYKVSTLDATVGSTTVANDKHVAVQVSEANGVLTAITVTEKDIANATDLSALSGKTVTAVEMTGGTATTASTTDGTKKITINADGSSIKMTGYAKGSASGAVDATDSVNAAIGKLENQIAGKVDALDATVSGETSDSKVKVQVVQENGVLTAVTVTGTNIASASDLTNEIAHRKDVDGVNGDAYIADTTAHYISAATSLFSADKALDTALKTADDAMLTGVTAGYGISVSNKSDKSQTISAKVKNDGGLVVDSDGLHLGYIDAGMYDAN